MKLLRIFCGPMCAGKSTAALQVARRYARQKLKVVLVRPSVSRRAHEGRAGFLATKAGEEFPSFDLPTALSIPLHCAGADVVWIDEPSLFNDEASLPSIMTELRKTAIILVSGLGGTSELEPFGLTMPRLLAVADDVVWLTADCDLCGEHGKATRSLYVGAKPKSGQACVGGAETYRPACPTCWTNYMNASEDERVLLLQAWRGQPTRANALS